MRRPMVFVIGLVVAGSVSYVLSRLSLAGGPRLDAPKQVDVGSHGSGSRILVAVPISNAGNMPLEVRGFRTSCGCLTMRESRSGIITGESRLAIPPGDRAVIDVEMAIRGNIGSVIKERIAFLTNASETPEAAVDILASICGGLIAVPNELVIRDAAPQSCFEKTIEIKNVGSDDQPAVVGAHHTLPDLIESITIDGNSAPAGPICHISFRVSAKPGRYNGEITLVDAGNKDQLTIPVRIIVIELFAMTPAAVLLPRATEKGVLTEVSVLCKASRPGTFVLVQDRTPDIVNVAIRDAGREREEHEVCFSLKDNVSSGPPTVLDVARFVAIQNGERHEMSVPLVVPKVGMIDE